MGFGNGKYESLEALAAKLKPGEPFFVLRGQDALAPAAIDAYANLVEAAGLALVSLGGDVGSGVVAQGKELELGSIDIRIFAHRVRGWQEKSRYSKLPD